MEKVENQIHGYLSYVKHTWDDVDNELLEWIEDVLYDNREIFEDEPTYQWLNEFIVEELEQL